MAWRCLRTDATANPFFRTQQISVVLVAQNLCSRLHPVLITYSCRCGDEQSQKTRQCLCCAV